jgi:hypothetical protein
MLWQTLAEIGGGENSYLAFPGPLR